MRLYFLGILFPLAVTGCATTSTNQSTGQSETAVEQSEMQSDTGDAGQGLAFAQTRCSACHGVTSGKISANPKAPPFEAVVNVRGLTDTTMKTWLRDSHNYPGQMDFEIDAKHIDDLAAYMLTLKSPDYRPPIQ